MRNILITVLILIVAALSCASRGRERYLGNCRDRNSPASDVNAAEVYATLMTSCVAHWPMDDNEPNTTVLDVVGGYNGIANKNTEDLFATGTIGGAFDFNGVSDYVDTNNTFQSTFRDSFSVSLWVKFADGIPSAAEYLLGIKETGALGDFYIANNNGIIYAIYSYGITTVTLQSSISLSDGQSDWIHIVCTLDVTGVNLGNFYLYINSGLVDSELNKSIGISVFSVIPNLFLGDTNDETPPVSPINGLLDNVMLFNKALSQTEITVLYEKEY